MKSLLEIKPEILHHDSLSPLFAISIRNIAHTESGIDHLPELREQILRVGLPEVELETYLTALDQLSKRFDVVTTRASQIFPQQVFVWLYQLEDDFVRLLQEEKPIALVILSYFCILLHSVRSSWWTRGWMEHLLSEIHSSLNQGSIEFGCSVQWKRPAGFQAEVVSICYVDFICTYLNKMHSFVTSIT